MDLPPIRVRSRWAILVAAVVLLLGAFLGSLAFKRLRLRRSLARGRVPAELIFPSRKHLILCSARLRRASPHLN